MMGHLGRIFGRLPVIYEDTDQISPDTPTNGYVAEDGTTFYVAEDGTTYYVQET